jgi:hypothetical protein
LRDEVSGVSESQKEDEIREYIDEHFILNPEFAVGLPISVLDVISEAVEHFRG